MAVGDQKHDDKIIGPINVLKTGPDWPVEAGTKGQSNPRKLPKTG